MRARLAQELEAEARRVDELVASEGRAPLLGKLLVIGICSSTTILVSVACHSRPPQHCASQQSEMQFSPSCNGPVTRRSRLTALHAVQL
jgi:hypothetical protein